MTLSHQKIKETDLFAALTDDEISALVENMDVINVKVGENIIKEGDRGTDMYILYEGHVEVKKHTLNAIEEYTVLKLSEIDKAFFGEQSLVDSEARSATVTALQDCILLKLGKKNFDKLCTQNPSLGYKVYNEISKILSQRLRKANLDIVTLFDALITEIKKA